MHEHFSANIYYSGRIRGVSIIGVNQKDHKMKTKKINRATFNIPEAWDEVSLDMHSACVAALQEDGISKAAILARTLSALSGIPVLVLRGLKVEEIEEINQTVSFYFETKCPVIPADQFEFKGETYLVPSDIGEATFGEFVDLEDELENHKGNLWGAVPGIIGIYCRPIDETKYDPEKALERGKMFGALSMPIAEGLAAFFLTREEQSKTIILAFSRRRIEIVKREKRFDNSRKHMGGARRLISWPATIFSRWTRSQIKTSESFSVLSPYK